ncbi:hypothetical protein [Candidatus Marithrix sp. Canyon 246]|nr:hypothetical protein [Candidatus Marithrix sp. Canyon 246]
MNKRRKPLLNSFVSGMSSPFLNSTKSRPIATSAFSTISNN